jgi:hypothetical protein
MQAMTGTHRDSRIKTCAAIALLSLLLSACGGSGDSDSSSPPPSAGNVTVSGRVEFERPLFKNVANGGLNIATPTVQPARQVVVEAINPDTRARIGTATSTDENGNYSLTVPANTNVLISARAEIVKTGAAPTWDFKVRDNTSNGALYVLDGAAFNSGTANSTRNLRALTGWNGTAYVDADRSAAPFAILDAVYQAKELIRSAQASTAFPALDLYWSSENRATVSAFCTNTGEIGTTFYTGAVSAAAAGNCTPGVALDAGIYVLGDYADGNGDTDEFDAHVIAHEFGHYVEDKFSRSDSIGGTHSPTDELDMRVAFSEGWGNAYSGMALNDPVYRDSYQGVAGDSGFNLEADSQPGIEGWFSELSISQILWDLFDTVNDGADQVSIGFAPIYSVMTGPQKTTDALTSIFTFAEGLRAANPAQTQGINGLLTGEGITTTDAFGSTETNSGGVATALPIYLPEIMIGAQPISVCSSGSSEDRNKVGYRRFIPLNVPQATALTITVIGAVGSGASVAASDPDVFVYKKGVLVEYSDTTTNTPGSSETIAQKAFAAGLHIIEVYDYNVSVANSTQHCMTVSVTGP